MMLLCLRSSFRTLNPPSANHNVAWPQACRLRPWCSVVLCSFQPCSVLFGFFLAPQPLSRSYCHMAAGLLSPFITWSSAMFLAEMLGTFDIFQSAAPFFKYWIDWPWWGNVFVDESLGFMWLFSLYLSHGGCLEPFQDKQGSTIFFLKHFTLVHCCESCNVLLLVSPYKQRTTYVKLLYVQESWTVVIPTLPTLQDRFVWWFSYDFKFSCSSNLIFKVFMAHHFRSTTPCLFFGNGWNQLGEK